MWTNCNHGLIVAVCLLSSLMTAPDKFHYQTVPRKQYHSSWSFLTSPDVLLTSSDSFQGRLWTVKCETSCTWQLAQSYPCHHSGSKSVPIVGVTYNWYQWRLLSAECSLGTQYWNSPNCTWFHLTHTTACSGVQCSVHTVTFVCSTEQCSAE